MENWKPVPDYELYYEISDLGRMRGISHAGRWKKGRIVVSSFNGKYQFVLLHFRGKRKRIYTHRLVAYVFIGPSKMDINHKDGDRTNNQVSNLEYVTRSENMTHASRYRLLPRQVLDEDEVKQIRADYATGTCTYNSLAVKFNVTKSAINHVLNRAWKWVK